MCDRTFKTTSANQLAYNDYQSNHRLHAMATMQEGQAAVVAASSSPAGQVEALQLAVCELETARTAQARELEELRREKAQIGSTLGTTLIACFGILAFYADPESWKEDWFAGKRLGDSPAMSDRGARARSMMQNLKETE